MPPLQAVVRRRLIRGMGCWWHRCSASSLPSPASSPASFFWIWGSFWAASRPGTVGGVLGWREKYRQKKKIGIAREREKITLLGQLQSYPWWHLVHRVVVVARARWRVGGRGASGRIAAGSGGRVVGGKCAGRWVSISRK